MLVNDFFHDFVACIHRTFLQKKEIESIISILRDARNHGNQVYICGNGGSAGTATHFTADLFKLGNIKAICLNDNVPLLTALTNDDGWGTVYLKQLEQLFKPGDVLIAISVHGGSGLDKAGPWSQNLNQAISYVKLKGGTTIGFSGFDGGIMKHQCDVCIVVPVESTPIVEAMHVVLHHYITFELHDGGRK